MFSLCSLHHHTGFQKSSSLVRRLHSHPSTLLRLTTYSLPPTAMEFIDWSALSVDSSPTNDVFSYPELLDKPCTADSYASPPHHSLAGFFDICTYFDRPNSSIEASRCLSGFPATTPLEDLPQMQLKSSFSPAFNQSAFSRTSQFPSFNNTATNPVNFNSSSFSPHPSTLSLCTDAIQSYQALNSPSPSSPLELKHKSTDEEYVSHKSKPPRRNRGRPRLSRNTSPILTASSTKCTRNHRLPHNQVERKYREGLNAELERLHRTVLTLPQFDSCSMASQPRPSKAMILTGAIDYIKRLEKERDAYKTEIELLRKDRQARRPGM